MLSCVSGQYVEQELALHYGRLPPSFLPVNGGRLFSLQGEIFGAGERCILTLPTDFHISQVDKQFVIYVYIINFFKSTFLAFPFV